MLAGHKRNWSCRAVKIGLIYVLSIGIISVKGYKYNVVV